MAATTLNPRPRARVVVPAVLVAGALLVPWLAFAKWHIGSFLPNTAGAKSGGMVRDPVALFANLVPVAKIVASTQAIALLALVADLAISRRRAAVFSRELRFSVLWMIALPLAYVAADIQILSRYLLLVTPMVCVAGWRALESVVSRLAPRTAVLAAAAAASIAVAANAAFYARVVLPPSIAFSEDLQTKMTDLARYLHDNSMPDVVVAAADIGYLAYYSERRVLDLGGLVEPATARLREAHDYEEILAQGLYFDIPGYPRVDYLVDRDHEANRFTGRVVKGFGFVPVYSTIVRNLGIRKPGEYHYTLYRIMPAVEDAR